MIRNKPSKKPRRNYDVLVKLKHVGPIIAARWTGVRWKLTRDTYLDDKSIECWWPMPTKEQLNALEQYTLRKQAGG